MFQFLFELSQILCELPCMMDGMMDFDSWVLGKLPLDNSPLEIPPQDDSPPYKSPRITGHC